MTSRLERCSSCGVHIFKDATSCPFCSVRFPVKGLLTATAGVVALVAGIGCAYGCPDPQCSGGVGGTAGTGGEGGKSTTTTTGSGGFGGMIINDAGTD